MMAIKASLNKKAQ